MTKDQELKIKTDFETWKELAKNSTRDSENSLIWPNKMFQGFLKLFPLNCMTPAERVSSYCDYENEIRALFQKGGIL